MINTFCFETEGRLKKERVQEEFDKKRALFGLINK